MDTEMIQCTDIIESQFGFMSGRSTTYEIFILKHAIEKRREGQNNITDYEKTFDSTHREEMLQGAKCAGQVH